MYDQDDLRLAKEMLRIAYESHDGDEIHAARLYLREVKRGLEPTPEPTD